MRKYIPVQPEVRSRDTIKAIFHVAAFTVATMVVTCGDVNAQSLSTLEVVGVSNTSISYSVYGLNSNGTSDGSPSSTSAMQSFTGLNGSGSSQTMTFSGSVSASAAYGQLHVDSSGAVTNTYYNANNPVYYNANTNTVNSAGSPDGLVSLGFADFNDTLQYGGALQAGYQARYIFHITGNNIGYGAAADLSVSIAGNTAENFFDFDPGNISADWATESYAINGTSPQSIAVQFSDQFTAYTDNLADGSKVAGEANFSDTLTLAGIEIVDANGNPVSGVTVTAASGTMYSVVPEPATFAFLLPGAFWLICRQRRMKTTL